MLQTFKRSFVQCKLSQFCVCINMALALPGQQERVMAEVP